MKSIIVITITTSKTVLEIPCLDCIKEYAGEFSHNLEKRIYLHSCNFKRKEASITVGET